MQNLHTTIWDEFRDNVGAGEVLWMTKENRFAWMVVNNQYSISQSVHHLDILAATSTIFEFRESFSAKLTLIVHKVFCF